MLSLLADGNSLEFTGCLLEQIYDHMITLFKSLQKLNAIGYLLSKLRKIISSITGFIDTCTSFIMQAAIGSANASFLINVA